MNKSDPNMVTFLASKPVKDYQERIKKDPVFREETKASIMDNQEFLIKAAIAYEEKNDPICTDQEYDAIVRMMQRSCFMLPELWKEIDHPLYRDGSWQSTGMFYRGTEQKYEDDESGLWK